jgi:hypothetical protein
VEIDMPKKVVINNCYGGFSLSKEAAEFLKLPHDDEDYPYWSGDRDDPELVRCVETLGEKASGDYASLCINEIPDDFEWEIDEYDGAEWIRKWPRGMNDEEKALIRELLQNFIKASSYTPEYVPRKKTPEEITWEKKHWDRIHLAEAIIKRFLS